MKSEEYFEAEDTKLSLEINQREKENPTPMRKREYLDARLTTPFSRPLSEMKYKVCVCGLISDYLISDNNPSVFSALSSSLISWLSTSTAAKCVQGYPLREEVSTSVITANLLTG